MNLISTNMTHIGQSINNPCLFWYNDRIGMVILTDIWRNLYKSGMDDNQLLIHPEEREKVKELFASFGYKVDFDK